MYPFENEALIEREVHVFNYPCVLQTKCKPIIRYFNPGLYLFELYGAAGGTTNSDALTIQGGKGGYTRGAIQFYKKTKIYLFIGGKGTTATTGFAKGGWNGGGSGKVGLSQYQAAGGGGSTDIRIQCSSLFCRKLIAGGGGGAGFPSHNDIHLHGSGGSGGGSHGIDSSPYYLDINDNKGRGGNQTKGGKGGIDNTDTNPRRVPDGTLYYGGSMEDSESIFDSSCEGGGGGFYGGGAGAATGGGGGSGYVSDLFFSIGNYETQTIDGDSEFPDVHGNMIRGNNSSGVIKITVFSSCFVPFSYRSFITFYFKLFIFVIINKS